MPRTSRVYWTFVLLMSLCLLGGIAYSWPAVQDDAFIHLRYADHLLHQHMVSYDGVTRSYGASSLLYITILAILRSVTTSPLLPRVVSSASHLLLFAGLALAFARSLKGYSRLAWIYALVLLGAIAVPSSVRWLDDGMETSIVLIVASVLAFAAMHIAKSRTFSNRAAFGLVVLGFFTVLLRVEFLMLLGFVSLILFFARRNLQQTGSQILLALRCLSPLVGGLLGAAVIVAVTGSLLPDTAVAKALGLGEWAGTLVMSATAFASSLAFGMTSLLLWILTLLAVRSHQRGSRFVTVLANAPFPVTLFLATIRGQAVQGIRYFEWTLLFSILWNILELRETIALPEIGPGASSRHRLEWAGCGLAAILLVSVPVESVLLHRVFKQRSASLNEFRGQHLDQLSGLRVVAFDVGYIGYFSGSPLCDLAGLVNGRAVARLTYEQRQYLCINEKPQYGFLSHDILDNFDYRYDLSHWSFCTQYDLANLRSADLHYLVASPEVAEQVCRAAGTTPKPITPLLAGAAIGSHRFETSPSP